VFKRLVTYFGYSGISALLGLASVMYLTRTLTPKDMGMLGLFATMVFLLVPMLIFKCGELVGINKANFSDRDYIYFRNGLMSFSIVIFFIGLVFLVALTALIAPSYISFVIISVAISFVRVIDLIHRNELIQTGDAKIFGFFQLATVILNFTVTVVAISFLFQSWEGRLVAVLVAETTIVMIRIKYFSNITEKFGFVLDYDLIKSNVIYGAPLFIALGLSWIVFESDKLIVLNLFSIVDVGFYSVAYMLGSFYNVINEAVVQAIKPRVYSSLKQGVGLNLLNSYNRIYSLISIALATIASYIFYQFSHLILGDGYDQTKIITCIILYAFAFWGISRTSGIVIVYYKLNIIKVKVMFVAAIVNLTFSISTIPFFGLLAPAFGTALSFLVMAVLFYIYSRNELSKRGVVV
jgi:O-antigen/teichoic acid export membrane protein